MSKIIIAGLDNIYDIDISIHGKNNILKFLNAFGIREINFAYCDIDTLHIKCRDMNIFFRYIDKKSLDMLLDACSFYDIKKFVYEILDRNDMLNIEFDKILIYEGMDYSKTTNMCDTLRINDSVYGDIDIELSFILSNNALEKLINE